MRVYLHFDCRLPLPGVIVKRVLSRFCAYPTSNLAVNVLCNLILNIKLKFIPITSNFLFIAYPHIHNLSLSYKDFIKLNMFHWNTNFWNSNVTTQFNIIFSAMLNLTDSHCFIKAKSCSFLWLEYQIKENLHCRWRLPKIFCKDMYLEEEMNFQFKSLFRQ